MTPQHPAAPETEADASGLTEAERTGLAIAVHDTDAAGCSCESVYSAVERIVAERVRVVEGERDAALRSKVALVAKVHRLQDQIARASMEPGQDRQKAVHAYAARAESAEAAHERLRAGLEALADDFDTVVGFRGAATSLRALLAGGEAR